MNTTTLRTIGFIPLAVLGYLIFQVITYVSLNVILHSIFRFDINTGWTGFLFASICSGCGVYGFFMVGNLISPLISKTTFNILFVFVAIAVLLTIYMLFVKYNLKGVGEIVGLSIGTLVGKAEIHRLEETSEL